jgi:hypothetical protein
VVRKGDRIVVNSRQVGGPPREGELRIQDRVRWSDGHESMFAPAAGRSEDRAGSRAVGAL